MKSLEKLLNSKFVNKLLTLVFALSVLFLFYSYSIDIAKIGLFIIFCIILLAIGYLIIRFFKYSKDENIVFVFAFGIIAIVTVYSITSFLDIRWLYKPLLIVLGMLGMLCAFFDIRAKKFAINCPIKSTLTVIIFVSILSIWAYSYYYLTPDITGFTVVYKDLLWNIGNVDSLSEGLPAKYASISGYTLRYHFFSFLFKGIIEDFCGLYAYESVFVFSTFISIPFQVFAIVALSKKVFNNEIIGQLSVLGLYLFRDSSFFFFFTQENKSIIFSYFNNNYIYHTLYAPNGMDYAIPMMAVIVLAIGNVIENNQLSWKDLIACVILTFTLTLSKGPAGAVLIGALIGFVLFNLFFSKNNNTKPIVILSFVLTVVFAVTYVTFLSGYNVSGNGETSSLFSPFYSLLNSPFYDYLNDLFESIFNVSLNEGVLWTVLVRGILGIISFILFIPAICIPFILNFVWDIKNWKNISNNKIFLYALSISGFLLFVMLKFGGGSQLYFFYAVMFAWCMIGFDWLFNSFKKTKSFLKVTTISLICIALITSLYGHFFYSKSGIANALRSVGAYEERNDKYIDGLTKNIYEGLEWLRDNTDENSICATDRLFETKQSMFFYKENWPDPDAYCYYYSAFSERQFFLEGGCVVYTNSDVVSIVEEEKRRLDILKKLYSKYTSNQSEIMRENGIDYVIVTKAIHPSLEMKDQNLFKCFSNSEIDIYTFK